MRPGKHILIIGGDIVQRSILSSVLRTYPFHVAHAEGPRDVSHAEVRECHLLIVFWPVGVKPLQVLRTRLSKRVGYPIPLLMIAPAGSALQVTESYNSTVTVETCMEELLAKIKTVAARKRGPRKGYKSFRGQATAAACAQEIA